MTDGPCDDTGDPDPVDNTGGGAGVDLSTRLLIAQRDSLTSDLLKTQQECIKLKQRLTALIPADQAIRHPNAIDYYEGLLDEYDENIAALKAQMDELKDELARIRRNPTRENNKTCQ
jgi:hypothetical protein